LEGFPRDLLEKDTVHYCTEAERENFVITVDAEGLLWFRATNSLVNTTEGGWIFVLRDGILYGTEKKTDPPR
jgi:hypothetical protein